MSGAEAAQVLAAVQQRATALSERDAAALRRLLHPQFHWTSHRGELFDRDSYVGANAGGDLVWHRQTLTGAVVSVVADTAVVTGVVVDEVERDGTRQRFRMPVTQTWVRRDGRWACLAGHAGPLLEEHTARPHTSAT